MTHDDLVEALRARLYPDGDTEGFGSEDFLYAFGCALEALMYSRLFWPEFVEVKDMVFLKESMEDEDDLRRLEQAFSAYKGDRNKTEQSFNFVEYENLFSGRRGIGFTDEEAAFLMKILAEMWNARLKQLFPDRRFVVRLLNPNEDPSEEDLGLIFYQE